MGGYVAMRVTIERPDLVPVLVMSVTSAGIDRQRLGLPDWRLSAGDGDSDWVASPQGSLDHLVPAVTAPTLLLWATGDEISPLPLAHRLVELLPDAQLATFESTSHWFVLDNVEAVAARIGASVDGVSP